MRVLYRTSQFWKALFARASEEELARAQQTLTPELMVLFLQMQPGEQAHSLEIFDRLLAQGENNADLLVAALLHDVGKICHPLRTWERVAIVLGKSISPRRVVKWGRGSPTGWRRPFVVAEQHAAWGAELASAAGASPLSVEIIRRHQTKLKLQSPSDNQPFPEEKLIYRLQLIDDES